MPKLGMEPIRRASLIKATIAEIGEAGSLDVTVSQIAKRAGMSSALAHHYFGGKEQIFLAAMRHTMTVYGGEVRGALLMARSPLGRVEAIVRSSFSQTNFRSEVVAAWLNFYVLAQSSEGAHRLLTIYQRRLRSNLRHALRPMWGAQTEEMAERMAALIDGAYLRQSLGLGVQDSEQAVKLVMGCLPIKESMNG
ncbi:transcriptional regulator, TetR family [Thalassovita litoralis]|jgi:TetR/AcrR family transcriptional repressor of bet genes|uniref:HTH-type transcriptional regulator BetI n=1 Tax=Thalassovita litoralis TaxID=1010611 RepID=A0A521DKA2_9RHOB|nr:transcriptional regulator BetI [Thalassovita litoralis]SMO72164.1 transcriptional regulator, TetR family [Thalassovita litoralis]